MSIEMLFIANPSTYLTLDNIYWKITENIFPKPLLIDDLLIPEEKNINQKPPGK